jgi:hypothetical protein
VLFITSPKPADSFYIRIVAGIPLAQEIHHEFLCSAAFRARAQLAQIVPVVNTEMMAVFPINHNRVRTDRFYAANPRPRRFRQVGGENIFIRLGVHVLVTAPAGGTRAGGAHQYTLV